MTNSHIEHSQAQTTDEQHIADVLLGKSVHMTEDDDDDRLPSDDEPHELDDGIKSSRFKKLQKKLRKEVSWAIRDFKMIEDGDVVMVCISGGKDSFTLLDILLFLKRIAPIHFEVVAVNLDQKQPGFPEEVLPRYLSEQGIPYYILEKDTYSIVKSVVPEGKTYCSACSRLRRGSLYGFAKQIGATKVALGHHRDDILATFFLNLFHGGSLKAMPPKLLSDDKQNILIRPLAYVAEKDIIRYANYKKFPIIPCNLCGSQENLQRAMINDMLREWDNAHPKRLASMFKALQNVAPSQLADRNLFDFEHLTLDRNDDERLFEGDNIQPGVTDELDKMGLPINPLVQSFNPKFQQEGDNSDDAQKADQKDKPYKIPIINPLV
ncbi:tRNACytosine32-2-thiocytidine synthetase [Moraxella catarrhalis]|uniref:tRNA-cytidine(32) 2-sulfurtransferase n=1 Tax=Moraxella catarrhalis TaxID=480 RepID=A0AB36DKH0_MORCA|nr:tRNA 2-thiocytidine(32) synthetase TtcA [Moraxella catarrhalis]MPX28482.1 tRNA 2-thiocytidine(32) synthetase TtcA [Moraxella catarrhalis]OAV06141.1 tRNACytosine32-2-thiocytidine synthetase [Moraxella catarrhalis]OAV18335.1 tRNACytosine32-2-thiocytidine synthetase [Moraxella catarrhalis]OAV22575.1 tRNACytosine32-2-thiocytidine synthetase [Moraxella catarrhalis]RKL88633.1 tRNA 2-thiocytidine(32) synthetase TtcA [Moraxella catarrhalis]